MSLHAKCDECKKPIEPDDNHISIQGLSIVNHKKLQQAQMLHFDSQECLTKFVTKAINRPVLVTGSN